MAKRVKLTEADFPEPGLVFVAPTADGRMAGGRVLRRQMEGGAVGVLLAVSPWIGATIPSLDCQLLRETLVLTHHNWKGRREIYWVHDRMPLDFKIVGQIPLSDEELAETSNTFGGWQSVPLQVLTQWRWDHDREALLREEAEKKTADKERRQKAAAVRAEYLRTLTLESLAGKEWLESWDGEVSRSPRQAARQLLGKLVEELRAQAQLTKPVVRKLLKKTVESFNHLDAANHFIFTIEREDLCEAFEQIVCACGFPQFCDEVDSWREW